MGSFYGARDFLSKRKQHNMTQKNKLENKFLVRDFTESSAAIITVAVPVLGLVYLDSMTS